MRNKLKRTYGRGAGERRYDPIPLAKNRRRAASRLFDSAHAKYPQTGAYAVDAKDTHAKQDS